MIGTGICRIAAWTILLAACAGEGTGPGGGGGVVPVATVAVGPGPLSLTVGDTARLAAQPKDSAGANLAGRSVAWNSTNTAVATVSTSGLVTAVAAGTATINAVSEGRTGGVGVTVTALATGNECASPQPGWIWCDDFEQDRLSSYFEYDSAGGRFTRVAATGRNGSVGMRARWNAGQTGAGSLHLAFGRTPQAYFDPVDAGTVDYRDIYWRHWLRLQPGWNGGGADKLSRATIFASTTTWAQAMVGHVWSGGPGANQDYLYVDPASGTDVAGTLQTTTYNDFPNFRWLGAVRGNTAMFSAANAGTWYCVESHVKLNDTGQSNGLFEVWLNGTIEIQVTGMNWVGSYSGYGINAVFLEQFWNAGATQTQERYLDGFVVSTQRIGC